MQIGTNKVIVRPAMFVLVSAIVLGVAGVVGARWYSSEHKAWSGYAPPNRWSFSTSGGAVATLTPLTKKGETEIEKNTKGLQHVNLDEGIKIDVSRVGSGPQSVYIRDAGSLEGSKDKQYQLSFDAKSAQPFEVTFTVRSTEQKSGSAPLWGKKFTVSGDWKNYSATVPAEALSANNMQYMVIAGHLGKQTGSVSLRHIYFKGG